MNAGRVSICDFYNKLYNVDQACCFEVKMSLFSMVGLNWCFHNFLGHLRHTKIKTNQSRVQFYTEIFNESFSISSG